MESMQASTAEQDPELKNFDTKIKNDPIQLLKSIEEFSLSYDETRYEVATGIDSNFAGLQRFYINKNQNTRLVT